MLEIMPPLMALQPLPEFTQLTFEGDDRRKFLQNLVTQDVRKIDSETTAESFITNVKGKILAHGIFFEVGERIHFLTVHGLADVLLPHFEKYIIREEVSVTDASNQWTWWATPNESSGISDSSSLESKDPPSQVGRELEMAASPIQLWHAMDQESTRRILFEGSQATFCARWPILGKSSIVAAFQRNERLQATADSLKRQPQFAEQREVFEWLRIRAFWPWFGIDFSSDHLPQEVARDETAISFQKGCYLGQETVARLDALGQVQKQLRVIEFEESVELESTTMVRAGDQEIGQISSWGRREGRTVAFAMLRRSHFQAGTCVEVNTRKGTVLPLHHGHSI